MPTSLLEAERMRQPGAPDADCVRAIAAAVIDDLQIDEPPVDAAMVASWLGVAAVVTDPALLEAGCLICRDGRLEVRVRESDSAGRQRFTICHECGHTFFPEFQRATRYRCTPGRADSPLLPSARADSGTGRAGRRVTDEAEVEALCDLAASELLMPGTLFVPDAYDAPFGLEAVAELAERYEVSLEAAARRYVSARTEDMALVILEPAQSPRQRGTAAPAKLRVRTSLTTGHWPYIPRHKSADAAGPLGRALDGEVVHEMTHVSDIFQTHQEIELSARIYSYYDGSELVPRVLALLRPAAR